ncbi:FAD-dependent oxidoreductase [Williamsia soli]|uniref:FAD-dependent oxidoreductase n=1 Tax=Williamsia soli TaxID=364929 RepID=UPI001A9FC642|nr:FAD-binding oxidoreductase [Williamsia soli]
MTPGEQPAGHLTRRRLLQGTLVGGVAVAISGGAGFAAAAPRAADWATLAASLTGQVILPAQKPAFTTAKQIFNTRYDGSTPVAVVVPRNVSDVQRAMAFAVKHRLKIAGRSGGHSYTGASAANRTMVLDLRTLDGQIVFDAGTGLATVPPAATLYGVAHGLAQQGRTLPVGTCATVGAAGLTLGGGLGVDSRQYGLTCDNLAAATVVLPSGDVVTASPGNNDDLFWALRGGGGGNFGIVTSLTYRTAPAVSRDIVTMSFAPAAAAAVISGWRRWLPGAERSAWANLNIGSDRRGGVTVGVLLVCAAGTGRRIAADIAAAIGVAPTGADHQTLDPMAAFLRLSGGATAPRHGFVAGSDIVGQVTDAVANSIVTAVRSRSRAGGGGLVIIDPLDGAIADVAASGTAFPWRSHAASLQWFTDVVPGGSYSSATSWVSSAHRTIGKASAGAYVNYLEAGVAPARYFGGNLPRLRTIRTKYDPARILYSGVDI